MKCFNIYVYRCSYIYVHNYTCAIRGIELTFKQGDFLMAELHSRLNLLKLRDRILPFKNN